MDFQLFSKIIDENAHYLNSIRLYNFGEPLLHPDLPKMIRYCKKNYLGTSISTNATLLKPEVAEKLIDAGLDYVVFSFDGATKETYERIRKGANFDEVRKNITSFIYMKQEKGVKTPFIRIQIIKMKETEAEIQDFYNFWKRSGVDSIRIKGFDTFAGSIKTNSIKNEYLFDYGKSFRYPCKWLWEEVVILVDGTVVMCCRDYDGEIELGNIKEKTLKEIWNSKQMLEMRKKQKYMDFNDIPLCSKCKEWEGMPIDPSWPISCPMVSFHEFITDIIK
jgi:radical SAM protein with 4Fe4S-binding SPASM domain